MVDAVLTESLGDDRQSDDVSVLAVRIARLGRFEQIVFPAVAGRLLGVRAAIRQWLESGGLRSEVVADALLAASEATANAVEHGAPSSGSPVTVDLAQRTPGSCTLTVRDAGVWRDRGDEGDRGRGLEVIDKLVHRIDVTRDGAGTCLTMTIVDHERPVPTDDR